MGIPLIHIIHDSDHQEDCRMSHQQFYETVQREEEYEHWNKCDVCGRFISYADIESGKAVRQLVTPDSDFSVEEYETLCDKHKETP